MKYLIPFFAALLLAATTASAQWEPTWDGSERYSHVSYQDNSTNCTSTDSNFPAPLDSDGNNAFAYYMYDGQNSSGNPGTLDVVYVIQDAITLTEGADYILTFGLKTGGSYERLKDANVAISHLTSDDPSASASATEQAIDNLSINKDNSSTYITETFNFPAQAGGTYYLRLHLTGSLEGDLYSVSFNNFKIIQNVKSAVTISPSTNGTVKSSGNPVKAYEEVTLTVTPDEGYHLQSLTVTETESGNSVAFSGGSLTSPTATFKMPTTAVTVTATFTDNLTANDNAAYLKVPATDEETFEMPSYIKSLKVYDDGGSDNDYSNDCDGYLTIAAPEGYRLRLSGSAEMESSFDYLYIYDGTKDGDELYNSKSEESDELSIREAMSTANKLTIHVTSDNSSARYGLNLTVEVVKSLSHTDISIADIAAQTYTGSALTPAVAVTDGETTLAEGTDYKVEYADNTNVGTATATITGIGSYCGSVEKTFAIGKATPLFVEIEDHAISCVQTLANITLPDGYTFADESQELTIGENTVALNYNPDADNYETVSGDMTVTVEHSFTNYVYNKDATTEADGTETALCDHGCGATDTHTVEGTMLPSVVTSLDDHQVTDKQHAKKYIEHGKLIIEVNGVKYDVAGRAIK